METICIRKHVVQWNIFPLIKFEDHKDFNKKNKFLYSYSIVFQASFKHLNDYEIRIGVTLISWGLIVPLICRLWFIMNSVRYELCSSMNSSRWQCKGKNSNKKLCFLTFYFYLSFKWIFFTSAYITLNNWDYLTISY